MKFTTAEIAAATNGTVAAEFADVEIDGATQDSRAIEPGHLFVPLVAARDGHDFIDTALQAGASAYITHRPNTDGPGITGGPGISVADTTMALRDLGRAARQRIPGPVIGITGSVGKTSTKDLLAGALGRAMPTHASAKSFNNEIGVPLTLINTPDDAHAAIIEMGARGIGHVAELCDIATPTIGIITTVAAAHTGEFGSVKNIAVAKGELVEALPPEGLAVLNGDNPYVTPMVDRTLATVLTFGTDTSCNVHVHSISLDDELRATFVLDTEWGQVTATPSTRGAHMATNVAAAAGTALWLGATVEQVEEGLAEAAISPWRMEIDHTTTGALVINDTYNANPTSMRGALDSLAALSHDRKVAIVGYMAELGSSENEEHRQIATEIKAAGIEMIAVGTNLYGVEPSADPAAALGTVGASTAVLIKGSRSAGLEKVAAELLLR